MNEAGDGQIRWYKWVVVIQSKTNNKTRWERHSVLKNKVPPERTRGWLWVEINAEVECLNLYTLIKNYWSGAKQGKKWPYFSAPNTEEETTEGLAKLTLSYGPCDFDQTVKQTNCNKYISLTHTHTHTHTHTKLRQFCNSLLEPYFVLKLTADVLRYLFSK